MRYALLAADKCENILSKLKKYQKEDTPKQTTNAKIRLNNLVFFVLNLID